MPCGVGREGEVCTCQSPPPPPGPHWGPRYRRTRSSSLRKPKGMHPLRPGREHKSRPALGALGPTGGVGGLRHAGPGGAPSHPPVGVVLPRLSSPPFPQRPRGQSRCHDTARRWAALAAVWAQPPCSEPRWEGSGGSAPAPGPEASRDWQKAPHTPQNPESLALGKEATQMQAWGSRGGALKEDLRPSSPPTPGP